MAEELVLEMIPTGTSGWISVAQSNFDLVEAFVNALHNNTIIHNGDVVTHNGEILVRF